MSKGPYYHSPVHPLCISQYESECIREIASFHQYVCTVYPKKYAHGFVVLCFVVVMQSFIINSHEVFIHIHQGCFAGSGAIVRLSQCQWSKPDGYGKISQCITTTKHSKAKTIEASRKANLQGLSSSSVTSMLIFILLIYCFLYIFMHFVTFAFHKNGLYVCLTLGHQYRNKPFKHI